MNANAQELNIHSRAKDERSKKLSNFAKCPFELDGVTLASIEGLLQGIKYQEGDPGREKTFEMSGLAAKVSGRKAPWTGMVYWKGETLQFGSEAHRALLIRGLEAKFTQCEDAKAALLATGGLTLVHKLGRRAGKPGQGSLPNGRFCETLMRIRDQLRATETAPILNA